MQKKSFRSKNRPFTFQIMQCASEGLEFLDERKDFWQQQKPVYARKNEMHPLTPKRFGKKVDRRNALPSNGESE